MAEAFPLNHESNEETLSRIFGSQSELDRLSEERKRFEFANQWKPEDYDVKSYSDEDSVDWNEEDYEWVL